MKLWGNSDGLQIGEGSIRRINVLKSSYERTLFLASSPVRCMSPGIFCDVVFGFSVGCGVMIAAPGNHAEDSSH